MINGIKISSIVEHLVNNHKCRENVYLVRFKIIKSCVIIFNLIKHDTVCILITKPNLGRQKEFDYTVSLFS